MKTLPTEDELKACFLDFIEFSMERLTAPLKFKREVLNLNYRK